jgi:integrase
MKKRAKQRWKFCRLYKSAHPKTPWRVIFRQGGKRHQRWHRLKADAEAFADIKDVELQNAGTADDALDADERMALLLWREAERPGSLAELVKAHLERRKAQAKAQPLRTVIDALLTHREAEGKAPRTLKDLRLRLERMETHFGGATPVCDIATDEVDAWLSGLPVGPQSVTNYRRVAHSLFEFAARRGWTDHNPVASALRPKVRHRDVAIYSPKEAARLLAHCADDALPALVVALFSGLRTAELLQLDWSQIDLAEKVVRITRTKTGRPRIAPIPPNAVAWLKPYATGDGPLWPLSEETLSDRWDRARKAAGIEGDKANAARHSFGTYRVADSGDVAKTALEMGNTPEVVQRHYNRVASPKQGKAFFSIVPTKRKPSNVVSIERGRAA